MTLWAIKTKPMIDTENNIVFITNEIVILVCSYLVLLFSDFVPSFEERYKFGYMYIWIFLFQSVLNLAMFLYISGKDLLKSIRLRNQRKQYQQQRKAIQLVPNEKPIEMNKEEIKERIMENFKNSPWLKSLENQRNHIYPT